VAVGGGRGREPDTGVLWRWGGHGVLDARWTGLKSGDKALIESDAAAGLPGSEHVDTAKLSRLFSDRTTSYKYFFFLALLDCIAGPVQGMEADLGRPIPLSELAVDMVLAAWYPHGFCRLSFGPQDMLQQAVDSIEWGPVRGSWIQSNGEEWRRLRNTCAAQLDPLALVRYVPYRLIRPFFAMETTGLRDDLVNTRITELADRAMPGHRTPYCFTTDRMALVMDHEWLEYFLQNNAILRGWTSLKLAEYLQSRNPNIPGIVAKLTPPLVRDSLSRQTAWWREALTILGDRARCIYSGSRLSPTEFSLDHYLPWSFVAHNRDWNLVPATRAVNSSKSDRIPDTSHIAALARLQHEGIKTMAGNLTKARWLKSVEPFMIDLHLDAEALLDRNTLTQAYEDTLQPLSAIAERQGFVGGWRYIVS
jgi:hypothetical protein